MEFNKLEQQYSVVLCHWNGGILVKPDTAISDNETKSLSRPYFTVFNRKGNYCIHLSGLFDRQDKQHYALKSARLKKVKTFDAALGWINRFRHLNDDEQNDVLARHDIQARDKNLVTLLCDYWRLEYFSNSTNKWELLETNINHDSISKLYNQLRLRGKYRLIKSVRRHFTTDKTTLKEMADKRSLCGVSVSASPVRNSNMGVSDYNKTPKRNRTAKFWNYK